MNSSQSVLSSDGQVNILQYLWSTSPRSALKNTKAKITQHIKEFETEVKLIDRKTVRRQNVEIIKSLNAPLETLGNNRKPVNNVDSEIDFPVSTVAMYRNYTFVGRDTDLDEITKFLFPQARSSNQADNHGPLASGEPRVCILHGIGCW